MSVGVVSPIEGYATSPVPTMHAHLERVQMIERLGFAAVWLRDVPFNVPSFGDAGQLHDPFVYLGYLAGRTERIALGVASIVLPLRHPAHVAKAATSADVLSGGRVILGVASGDRPEEYPALGKPFATRGASLRASVDYLERMAETNPVVDNEFGRTSGTIDMLPKPVTGRLPLLTTGSSQQDEDWRALRGDGWMTYPRGVAGQASVAQRWRERLQALGQPDKPLMQPLYIDVVADPEAPPQPMHLGFRSGINGLLEYLQSLEAVGVNHVALNLRFNRADVEETLAALSEVVLPNFHQHTPSEP